MNATTNSLASQLNDLIETAKDGQEGFRVAAENVKDLELKDLFTRYSLQRAEYVSELQNMVATFGHEPEKTSSLTSALHRGWIDVKSAFTQSDDHAILAECERGEDVAVAEYRKKLEDLSLPASVIEIVQKQYAGIQAAHEKVKALRDASAAVASH